MKTPERLSDEEIKLAVYKNNRSKVNWTKIVTPRDYIVAEAQRDDTWEKARAEFKKELIAIDCILGAESRDKALVALIIRLEDRG